MLTLKHGGGDAHHSMAKQAVFAERPYESNLIV
jgi:hypothetical protein